jgi:hypothetical protein
VIIDVGGEDVMTHYCSPHAITNAHIQSDVTVSSSRISEINSMRVISNTQTG